jgi:glyoxylase-like metal-dependent hydrolase (beta-lactamase superfamily II)
MTCRFVAASVLLAAFCWQTANAQNPAGVPENATTQVSEHVWAIVGFPNIAYVVGERATLAVDTGLGPRNGAVVLREARKLAKGPVLYLTTTHYHPEHAAGEPAFPPSTILIRPRVQQEESDRFGNQVMDLFRSRSEQNRELLAGVELRPADILFDEELRLDLGGVTVRLMWLGAAHSQGDELIFVEGDGVLISGDIVQNKLVPNAPNENASVRGWLAILDKLEPLKPRFVVPDHGALGDGSLIAQQKAFMLDVQRRALELKRQGTSAEEAGKMLQAELGTKYPDWQNLGPVPNFVRRVYAEGE